MPYALSLATPETRDLVVTALRAAADQRTRVATKAAREVATTKASGRDVRAQAVKVTLLLAEAADLTALADELADLEDLPVVTLPQLVSAEAASSRTAAVIDAVYAGPRIVDRLAAAIREARIAEALSDGTSPEAQRLAAMAGLTDAIVEDGVDTHATAEDEPTDDDVVEVLR